jgi:ferritin
MNEKVEKALNEQLNKELFSAYLYASMAAYFESKNLKGFSNWMTIQAQEETTHAKKFYDFINDRGGRVRLTAIEGPKQDWKSASEVFEETLEHERSITASINDLLSVAREHKDNASEIFLQWFVTEQVEEEANVDDVLNQVKMVESAPGGLFLLDRELGQRTFTPPPAAE